MREGSRQRSASRGGGGGRRRRGGGGGEETGVGKRGRRGGRSWDQQAKCNKKKNCLQQTPRSSAGVVTRHTFPNQPCAAPPHPSPALPTQRSRGGRAPFLVRVEETETPMRAPHPPFDDAPWASCCAWPCTCGRPFLPSAWASRYGLRRQPDRQCHGRCWAGPMEGERRG